jgi:hypothetical protein
LLIVHAIHFSVMQAAQAQSVRRPMVPTFLRPVIDFPFWQQQHLKVIPGALAILEVVSR